LHPARRVPAPRPAEVDLLVVAPCGVVFVETKSAPDGELDGDAATWRWKPLREAGALLRQAVPRNGPQGETAENPSARLTRAAEGNPRRNAQHLWVEALVVLSSPHLEVFLTERGRTGVYGPDGDAAPSGCGRGRTRPMIVPIGAAVAG
jgi:hypothetical protein